MQNRPPPGTMVYWRFRGGEAKQFEFGYCTYVSGHNMVRMGRYNGDNHHGPVVDINDIEWKPHHG